MPKEKLPTDEPSRLPPTSAALKFVKNAQAEPSVNKASLHEEKVVEIQPEVKPASSTKPSRRKAELKATNSKAVPIAYLPLSTRIRADLKRRLKRLSHAREDCGHEIKSIQQFFELALIEWLDSQDDESPR